MSFQDMLRAVAPYQAWVLVWLVGLPLLAYAGGRLCCRHSERVAARFLSVPVYLAVLPGTVMLLAVLYRALVVRESLWADFDVLLCFGPILSMGATLFAVRRIMPFARVPGFDRITGLMVLAAGAFGVIYFLDRLHFLVGFFSSLTGLFLLFVVAFAVLKLAAHVAFGARSADPGPRVAGRGEGTDRPVR